MATQSLYRRYRPRRFSEVRGQEHVVRALRNAVINQREGQAYLFSGPRGTGKTTSARILAKVLNCERPVDGEPCCECDSCLAVERGTSYDVHELDAASNNGVDAMRDLIEKASLGTPGRHKVYILDEVHMLSQGCRGGTAEDAGGTATARRVRAGHHRSAEGQRHHPQPYATPAVPSAADGRARTAHSLAGGRRRHRSHRRSTAIRAAPGRRFGTRHDLGTRARRCQRWRGTGSHAARRVRRGVHRTRSGPRLGGGRSRRVAGSRPANIDRGDHPASARLLPGADGTRARAASRAARGRGVVAGGPAGRGVDRAGDGAPRRDAGRDAPCARSAFAARGRVGAVDPRRCRLPICTA